ncbi:ATP-grasp domain-containing protein [Psychroflexus aestuariivivens]|uniref:ATP-grasp domain-containing protein n=1 Tax=Psychroflexus aestuariivivens TaxID=1795040 RepID=UPI000FDBB926|nr:ATP-grasp domain-containing protein [Psychroflexus aestuariivivens]
MKKLLLLGGLRYLIPVIEAAKQLGHYVITCDYIPENIAHNYSDEYHNVSITDKEQVLSLAKKLNIDGIMSFAVDPGVVTAAYVAEKMNLPSPGPLKSIEILQNKALFREFLKSHNFNVPFSKSYSDRIHALKDFEGNNDYPVIVKPVDAAGSKGVNKVKSFEELNLAILNALKFSPSKTFIIEEFLESKVFSSDSDSFSINGELVAVTFSAQRFDTKSPNPFTPSAYSWPSNISENNQAYLKTELQRLITLLDLKSSVYNIEVRETLEQKAYIMEVSPRGGGNRLSEMIRYATGTDFIRCAVQSALGEDFDDIKLNNFKGFWAEIILYSNSTGIFEKFVIDDKIRKAVVETDLWVKQGEIVNAFNAANDAIGTVVLQFDNKETMEKVLKHYSRYFKVVVNIK